MRLYSDQGRAIELSRQLGRGGEGSVFEVMNHQDLVAKIYHKPITTEKASKITAMAQLRTERLGRLSAWPIAALYDKPHGAISGFLMPKVSNYFEVHTLYGPKDRLSKFPTAGMPFLACVAANVARAFAAVHDHNHVIGDVNHGNIVVSNQATVMLIDCDSFQIASNGQRYFCEVGVSTHTPPELQGKQFRVTERSQNHDAFGLAVVIFQLLCLGRHPFAGQYLGAGDMPIEKAISEYRFAYGPNATSRQMTQPPINKSLEIVISPLMRLFERSFGRDMKRPNSAEWVAVLEQFQKQFQRCTVNSGHDFPKNSVGCPWCYIEGISGARLFNIVVAGGWQSGIQFDIGTVWREITAVAMPSIEPLPIAQMAVASAQFSQLGQTRRILAWSGWGGASVVSSCALLSQTDGMFWWIVAALCIGCITASAKNKAISKAKLLCATELQQAQQDLNLLVRRWQGEATPEPFNAAVTNLNALRVEYDGLAKIRDEKLLALKNNIVAKQTERFLDRFRISNAAIPGIGPGRKATLESYGIETAADVKLQALGGIPGFGPTLTSQLLAWRQQIETKFVFDPRQGVDPADTAAVEHEIVSRRRVIETELRQGPAVLRQTSAQINSQRANLRPLLQRAAQRAAQAEANLKSL